MRWSYYPLNISYKSFLYSLSSLEWKQLPKKNINDGCKIACFLLWFHFVGHQHFCLSFGPRIKLREWISKYNTISIDLLSTFCIHQCDNVLITEMQSLLLLVYTIYRITPCQMLYGCFIFDTILCSFSTYTSSVAIYFDISWASLYYLVYLLSYHWVRF
jgi:hypothetical protein